jgi:2-dehydropantoate 2-reductase
LSKNNNVTLVGRKDHINKIKKQGLLIKGNTKLNVKIDAEKSVKNIKKHPDILILSVKSYDTINAINQAKSIIDKDTIVMSLQNGLDNIEKIEKVVDRKQIISCITTHGTIFTEPGIITHTGFGRTIVGGFDKDKLGKVRDIAKNLTESGIKTDVCKDIEKEIWIKAIINSSINTLTAIFDCKNGYLLKNPILENIVEKICKESTDVANSKNLSLSYENMIKRTKQVIFHTSNNYSSMLQSIKKNNCLMYEKSLVLFFLSYFHKIG